MVIALAATGAVVAGATVAGTTVAGATVAGATVAGATVAGAAVGVAAVPQAESAIKTAMVSKATYITFLCIENTPPRVY
jgi:hypothetical protein